MASFRTHISFSTALGVAYGGAAGVLFDVPVPTCILAGGLCSVSGMLPDLDSNASRPLKESMALAGAVIAMMVTHRFRRFGMSPESTILAGAGVYLLIRFGLAELLRRYTAHRGMFHSLPAAAIFGLLEFLLAPSEEVQLRMYLGGAVVIGYVSHLLLDELCSIEWYRGRLRLKPSFGTAMKLFDHGWWPTILVYLQLLILAYVALKEPGWMRQHFKEQIRPTIRQASGAINRLLR
jgi:membrane-bound metal-dependent hydrolase YbcI (DUF457 family)